MLLYRGRVPPRLELKEHEGASDAMTQAADGSVGVYGEGEAAAADQASSPWVVGYTEEGYTYWFNTVTGESSWTNPEAPAEAAAGATDDGTDAQLEGSYATPADPAALGVSTTVDDVQTNMAAMDEVQTESMAEATTQPAASELFGSQQPSPTDSAASGAFGMEASVAQPAASELFGGEAEQQPTLQIEEHAELQQQQQQLEEPVAEVAEAPAEASVGEAEGRFGGDDAPEGCSTRQG